MSNLTIAKDAQLLKNSLLLSTLCKMNVLNFEGSAKHELKLINKKILFASQSLENWFLNNKSATEFHKTVFKREFSGNKSVIILDLLSTLFDLTEESLENITDELKNNLITENNN